MKYAALMLTGLFLLSSTWVLSQNLQSRAEFPPASGTPQPTPRGDTPPEIGLVRWQRDFAHARQLSQKTGKPILLLFQEVPGCAGCQKFGREVLSHPIIVDTIEHEFQPVLVYNNRSDGQDAELLKQFGEPAWNYQVLRFLNSAGKDIIPRKAQVWTVADVAQRLAQALRAADRDVPQYLTTLVASTDDHPYEKAAFAMSCFWTGEFQLGNIPGVVTTEAGWFDGREVTLVRYDLRQIALKELAKRAARVQCAHKIYTTDAQHDSRLAFGRLDQSYRPAAPSDQKKQLSRWPAFQRIPGINAVQLTKLNALVPINKPQAMQLLSPRQRDWFANARRPGTDE